MSQEKDSTKGRQKNLRWRGEEPFGAGELLQRSL